MNGAYLRNLYRQVPELDCQGKCPAFCRGQIGMHKIELERMGRELQHVHMVVDVVFVGSLPQAWFNAGAGHLEIPEQPDCPLLHAGRCLAYQARPMVCRLWGTVKGAVCPWGCRARPRLLSPREATRLLMLSGGLPPARTEHELSLLSDKALWDTWHATVDVPEWTGGGESDV